MEDLSELWFAITGSSNSDSDDCDHAEPGYERTRAQREDDCKRVRIILAESDSDAVNTRRGPHGETLLCAALQYDHRHAAQMIKVVVEAGADLNMETHLVGGEYPLDTEWLEIDDESPHAAVNRSKREYLVAHGARHGPAAMARAAEAAAVAEAREAQAAANEAALDERLSDARRADQMASVPCWDDDCPGATLDGVDSSSSLNAAEAVHGGPPAAIAALTYKGRSETAEMGADEEDLSWLFEAAERLFELPPSDFELKLILRGKALQRTDAIDALAGSMAPLSTLPKVMVMASARAAVAGLRTSVPDRVTASFAAEHGSKKGGIPTSRGVRQASLKKR